MRYFKTHLPVEKIRNNIHTAAHDEDKDTCIVEIENKKTVIITVSASVAENLKRDQDYISIELTDIVIAAIKVVYRILSVSGNKKLFGM